MLKALQKKMIAPALLVASLASSQAQVLYDQYNVASGWERSQGYSITPICGGSTSIGTVPFSVPKTYGALSVTYNFNRAAIDSGCTAKNPANQAVVTPGFLEVTNNAAAYVEVGPFPTVTHISATISWTGGTGRRALLQKVVGGVVTDVHNFLSPAGLGESGELYEEIPVNATNVTLRFVPTASEPLAGTTTPGPIQRFRIHDLWVYDTPLGLEKASLFEQGATTTVVGNVVTVSSPSAGVVEIVNTNGIVVDSKEIKSETAITVPQSGIYVVRLVTNNKVSTKKIAVL